MRTAILATAAALTLVGCGPTVDTIDADAPRTEKDEVFTTYIQDTYGEDYPTVMESAPDLAAEMPWLCSALDDGHPTSTLEEDLGFDAYPQKDKEALLNIVYQGTRVYCPRHTPSVEWMHTP